MASRVVCKVKINVMVYVTIRGVIFGFFQRLYIVIWRSYLDMNMEALTYVFFTIQSDGNPLTFQATRLKDKVSLPNCWMSASALESGFTPQALTTLIHEMHVTWACTRWIRLATCVTSKNDRLIPILQANYGLSLSKLICWCGSLWYLDIIAIVWHY